MTQGQTFSNHLDWVTFTTSYTDEIWEILPPHAAFERTGGTWAGKRYRIAHELANGGKAQFNPDRQELGVMVDLPGQALGEMRRAGFSDEDLLNFMTETVAKPTRIDYAQNIFIEGAKISDLRAAHEKHETITTMEVVNAIEQVTGGEGYTLEIGARKSDFWIRAYNKAAQMDMLKEAWIRVEIQTRNAHSRSFLRGAKANGFKREFSSKVHACFYAPTVSWWMSALDAPDLAPEPLEEKQHDWEKWMNETVFRSFMKNLPKHTDFCADFIDKLSRAYHEQAHTGTIDGL